LEEKLYSNAIVDIIKRSGKIYIQFEYGHSASGWFESEISHEELTQVRKSEADTWMVLNALRDRKAPMWPLGR
jgi:hypothetical protein